MNKTYVCVGGMRNGKSYHRALDLAQTIMQEYPNQSVCVVSLDDYKKALADEREKTIKDLYASDKSGTLKELLNMARAEARAKTIEEVYERFNSDLGSFGFWIYEQMKGEQNGTSH